MDEKKIDAKQCQVGEERVSNTTKNADSDTCARVALTRTTNFRTSYFNQFHTGTMGLCLATGMSGTYTYDELKSEGNQLNARLPLAELQVGGIIKLQGVQSFFSTKPLLDPKWLKERLTMSEYQSLVGMAKMFSPHDIPHRTQTAANGAQAATDVLNQQWNSRGVYLTFSMGEMHSNVTALHNGRATTQHKQDAFLYIRID